MSTEQKLKCEVCGYEWESRLPEGQDPIRCPNHTCQSTRWKEGLPEDQLTEEERAGLLYECQKCGHTWTPLKKDPAVCPNCKSYSWKEQ